jgi:uncharacterized protein
MPAPLDHVKFVLGEAGVLAAGRWRWLRALSWATLLFAITLGFFLASIFLGSWFHLPADANYAIALVFPGLGFFAYAQAVRFGERRRPEEILLTKRTPYDLLGGVALGFGMLVAMTAILWILGLYSVQRSAWNHAWGSFVYDSYISAMLEELAFRAILLRILARVFGPLWGLVLSSALFGVAHLSHGTWVAALEVAFNGGLTMGLLYMVTGRLWMSVGMHLGWDFTEESLLGVNSTRGLFHSTPIPGKIDLLTGGNYGPDASILAGIVGSIVLVIIWIASSRAASSQAAAS